MDYSKVQYYDYNHKLKVHDKLFTPLHGIKLTDGLFKTVFDNNIEFNLTQLDMDRMKYYFNVKMGIPTDAEPYPGHFEFDLRGQTASQYLMCAGNALRWVDNDELRKGMTELVDILEASQEDDGFLMPVNKFDFAFKEYPHYVRIWLTYALVAAALGGEKRALRMLRHWQDWFNHCDDLPIIKYLELAFQGVVASPYVYMTPVGKKEDCDVTIEHYQENWRLGQFLSLEQEAVNTRRQHGKEPHPHGSELEGMEGYLDLYRYTGKAYYLNAVINCMYLYKRDWQHAGGGIVMCERLKGGDNMKRSIYRSKKYTYNELCATAFWLQLSQRLHRLYPHREDHVFEMEQSLYNIAIAAQNGTIDIRNFMWMDMQKYGPIMPNHCCSGVGTRIFASLPEYLYTMNKNTLSCDIYAANELMWETDKQTIKVTETTNYPYDGNVKFTFNMDEAEEYTLRLRIPQYAKTDVDVFLNGEKVTTGKVGSYVEIGRIWQDGDEITFNIEFAFRSTLYYGDDDVEGYTRCAYTYGPLLLAVLGERNHENGIIMPGTPQEFIDRIKPTDKPLRFTIDGAEGYELAPYFELQEEEYVCYPMFEGVHKEPEIYDPWLQGVQNKPWLRD